ncbi:MAG: MoaD/ThiS family protein [Planctomycetaceae bacterium]
MAQIFIPPLLRALTGVDAIDVDAANVRQAIERLDEQFPGVRARLCEGDGLKPGLTVAVDGHVSSIGLLQKLKPDSEVHFLPAIGGG